MPALRVTNHAAVRCLSVAALALVVLALGSSPAAAARIAPSAAIGAAQAQGTPPVVPVLSCTPNRFLKICVKVGSSCQTTAGTKVCVFGTAVCRLTGGVTRCLTVAVTCTTPPRGRQQCGPEISVGPGAAQQGSIPRLAAPDDDDDPPAAAAAPPTSGGPPRSPAAAPPTTPPAATATPPVTSSTTTSSSASSSSSSAALPGLSLADKIRQKLDLELARTRTTKLISSTGSPAVPPATVLEGAGSAAPTSRLGAPLGALVLVAAFIGLTVVRRRPRGRDA